MGIGLLASVIERVEGFRQFQCVKNYSNQCRLHTDVTSMRITNAPGQKALLISIPHRKEVVCKLKVL